MVKYETTYFDRYVELLLKVRGKYQHKSYIELLDSLSQKNNERGFWLREEAKTSQKICAWYQIVRSFGSNTSFASRRE